MALFQSNVQLGKEKQPGQGVEAGHCTLPVTFCSIFRASSLAARAEYPISKLLYTLPRELQTYVHSMLVSFQR